MCSFLPVQMYIVPMLTKLAALFGPALGRSMPVFLSLFGLVFLVAAAYVWHLTAGLAATGLAFLLLEVRFDKDVDPQRGPRG